MGKASIDRRGRHPRPVTISWRKPSTGQSLRESGISLIGRLPWGTHLCLFCETKEDVIESALEFFRPAASANEYCVWVTSEPLTEQDALEALRSVPQLQSLRDAGALEIIDGSSWYLYCNRYDRQRLI